MGYWVRTRYGSERFVNSKSELESDFQLRGAIILKEDVILVDGKLVSTKDTLEKTNISKNGNEKSKTKPKESIKKQLENKVEEKFKRTKEDIRRANALSHFRKYHSSDKQTFISSKNHKYSSDSLYGRTIKEFGLSTRPKVIKNNSKNTNSIPKEEYDKLLNNFESNNGKVKISRNGVSMKVNVTKGVLKELKNATGFVNSKGQNSVAARMLYYYMVSDYVPYDTKRDSAENLIYNNGNKSLIHKYRKEASKLADSEYIRNKKRGMTGKIGFRKQNSYQDIKKPITRNVAMKDKKNYKKFGKSTWGRAYDKESHTIYDVVIDSKSVKWNRKNVEYIYRMPPTYNFQQTKPQHLMAGVKRGGFWNERASKDANFNSVFVSEYEKLMEECIKTGKDAYDVANSRGYLNY